MKKITIQKHNNELGPYFKSLNEEWLKHFFEIEPLDEKVLANPQAIIDEGGQILYALLDQTVIGCVALKHHGKGVFELTKMAVTADYQAHGIGAQLLKACIQVYNGLKGKKLYLESHSSLKPALKLYQRFGFKQKPYPFASEYQRSDVYMEYELEAE